MPRYFFHLRFGDRYLHDDEGVEFPSRSAAQDEAMTVVRDLTDHSLGRGARRWAGWFLQVSDDQNPFLQVPIGRPALDLVPAGGQWPLASVVVATGSTISASQPAADDRSQLAHEVVALLLARLDKTASLLERHRELRLELSDHITASKQLCARTRSLVARARLASPA